VDELIHARRLQRIVRGCFSETELTCLTLSLAWFLSNLCRMPTGQPSTIGSLNRIAA
jgi:hypothetical protein